MAGVEEWSEYKRRQRDEGKFLRDPLYDYVNLSPAAAAALDTPPLQRLRHLKQLGCASAVYPTAEHSRFAHSLGVAHLAAKAALHLHEVQPGLELRPDDATVVELAGLMHDVGHGPFSHVFEAEFLRPLGVDWSHEDMSARLIDRIFDAAAIDLPGAPDAAARARDCVTAGRRGAATAPRCGWAGREYLLQIVANGASGVDVDKFDYLRRDAYMTGLRAYDFASPLITAARAVDVPCGGGGGDGDDPYQQQQQQQPSSSSQQQASGGTAIAFKSGMEPTLHGLGAARAEMHQAVYTHRKVKCAEYMVVDAFRAANGPLRIVERAQDPDEFIGLTDAILMEARNSADPALRPAAALVRRLERRDMYCFCAEAEVPRERALDWPPMTAEEVVSRQDHNIGVMLSPDDVRVHNLKIDFGMGGEHPARRVWIWHRDGTVEPCAELPFEPRLCLQRKVRAYLAREEPDPAARAAVVRAVQAAFANAVRARLGVNARIIRGGGDRAGSAAFSGLQAPSRSGASQQLRQPAACNGGGSLSGHQPEQQQQQQQQRNGHGRLSVMTTPEKHPPPKRRLEAEDGGGGACSAGGGGNGRAGNGGGGGEEDYDEDEPLGTQGSTACSRRPRR